MPSKFDLQDLRPSRLDAELERPRDALSPFRGLMNGVAVGAVMWAAILLAYAVLAS